jgi:RNA polymerase sigma-70 factor (ECF subfamily)
LESADTDKRLKALRDCMKKMSLQNQQLIHLRFEKGNTVKKISQMSAYSADAIYKKLSRIYAVLQNCINQILIQGERT